ncbi:Holliday junction resolvase RuvX [Peptococcaceae bacterium]|nr:Holliday junction resolvase RuvX [Peptococcaceae bacterium]
MRILGLDIGDKIVGVSISDSLGLTAQALRVIQRSNDKKDIEALKKIIDKYQVERIVVGLPKNMNGTLGIQAEKIKEFSCKIKKHVEVPLEFWDERLTTVEAEKLLIRADMSRKKRKKVIDKLAATFILQGYLDRQKL